MVGQERRGVAEGGERDMLNYMFHSCDLSFQSYLC